MEVHQPRLALIKGPLIGLAVNEAAGPPLNVLIKTHPHREGAGEAIDLGRYPDYTSHGCWQHA